MHHICDISYITYEVKKSTFTSYILPYNLFEQTLQQLQQEHPKANHIVWAYRYLNAFDQVVENSTDNGEPKGCAGMPTLAHLRGEKIIDSAIITVRYFGGIKLGTGGMVRAYSSAAKEVIQVAQLLPYIQKQNFTLTTPYTLVKRYEHFCTNHQINFSYREYLADKVIWHLSISDEEQQLLETFQLSLL